MRILTCNDCGKKSFINSTTTNCVYCSSTNIRVTNSNKSLYLTDKDIFHEGVLCKRYGLGPEINGWSKGSREFHIWNKGFNSGKIFTKV